MTETIELHDDERRLAELGSSPLVGSPSDFGNHLAAETEKWRRVVRAANIKPD